MLQSNATWFCGKRRQKHGLKRLYLLSIAESRQKYCLSVHLDIRWYLTSVSGCNFSLIWATLPKTHLCAQQDPRCSKQNRLSHKRSGFQGEIVLREIQEKLSVFLLHVKLKFLRRSEIMFTHRFYFMLSAGFYFMLSAGLHLWEQKEEVLLFFFWSFSVE